MALMNLLKNNTSSVVTGLKNTNSTVSGNTNAVTNKTSTTSTSGKLSMKDFNSNSTLVKKYGTYENYLNGNIVSTASGVKLNTADTVLNTSSPVSATTPTSAKANTTPSFTSAEKLVDTASDKTIGSPVIPQANVQNQSQLGSHPGQIAYNEPMLNETPSAPSSEVQGEAIQAAYDPTQNIYNQKGTQDETQIPTQPTQTADTNTNVAQDDSVNLGSTTSDKVMSEEQFNANNGAGVSAAYGKDQSTLGIDADEGYKKPSTTQTASNILQTAPVDLTSGAKNVVSGTSTNRLLNQKKDETLTNLSNTVKNDTSNAMTFNVATALNGVKTQSNPLPAVTNPQYTETTKPQTTKPLMVEEAPEDTHTGFTTSSVIPTKVEEPKPTVEAQAPIEAAYGTPTTVGGNTSTSGYGYIDANGNVTTSTNPTVVNKVSNDTPPVETQPFVPTVTEETKPPVTTTDTTQTTETTDTTPEPNYYKPPQTVTDVQQIETTSQYQKAEDQFKDDTGVNQQEYDALMEYLTNAKKSGTELAENLKNLMLNLSDEQRQLLYALASKKRELAEQTARNLRARAAADANTQYALNQANYGLQAEQLARMGLGTSGYSDYLTSAAYATNRAGIQNANVEAEKAIQSALEAENEAQTSAESAYKDAVASANKEYQTSLYDINSSTDKGVLSAYLDKLTSDADARKNLRNDYLSAYENDLAKAEAQAKLDEQTAQSELANKQNQFSNKDTLKDILSSDYTKYTASEIDNMVELGMITTDQATEAKETQSNAYLEELASIINNGNIDEIVAEKNRLGKMKGKYLTNSAYNEASRMLAAYQTKGTPTVFNTNKYTIMNELKAGEGSFGVRIGNGVYQLSYVSEVDSDMKNKLEEASGKDATNKALIMLDGTLYRKANNKWYEVSGDVSKLASAL